MSIILLSTAKLCKTFSSGGVQQHVLRNLDVEIRQGDFTVIMGSSGAGKSTLLYALSGMDKPTLGTVTFAGEEISRYSNDQLAVFRRRHCGFVFQQIYLMDSMSVLDNVLAAGQLVSKDRKALLRRARELFAAVGISQATQKKFPTQLSGGEAQRVGIVRALINQPQIVFADEPTGQLNSAAGTDALDVLTRLNEQGQSIVMVTHDLKTARRGSRVLYLRDGMVYGACELGAYRPGDQQRHERLTAFLSEMGW
ncbi:MAG: ABC transporter ATP-binding protein [Clostridiales bacterium]|nr:ABC transporter ATP-binding protein [Clostridiales bacterium]